MWRQREDALILGGPLAVLPALMVVPVTISLFVDPAFRYARVAGVLLLSILFACEWLGLMRLAVVFRRNLDVLTFFAVGIVIVFWVVSVCSGVLLAIVLAQA
jgi:hypothetical protein